jgi:putative thioredoxin
MIRVDGLDPVAIATEAQSDPTNIELQINAADCAMAEGDFEGAAARLIAAVKATSGDERKAAREHLLILFTLIEADDPRLAKARAQLASALF